MNTADNEATLTIKEYKARALPRLAAIDALASKINFEASSWRWTPKGERYERLMRQQMEDEVRAGL